MKRSGAQIQRIGDSKALHTVIFVPHTSNGGLSSKNPGLDMIGLNLAINLSD
ncbi:MAG: acyloxyacyl hydrolase [Proteobacteria bacterium]|nr:acyloxyacyl hydrolase [Pseudomonadota bacterium]